MRHLRIFLLIVPLVLLLALTAQPPAALAGFTSTPTVPVTATPGPSIDLSNFPNLEFIKSANTSVVNVADRVTFNILVRNSSTVAAPNITVLDTLASQLTFVSAATSQGTFSVSGQDVLFTIGTVGPQTTVTLTITAWVNSLAQPPAAINNTAVLSASGVPIISSNLTSLQTVPSALPETGQTPMASFGLTLLLALGVMFLPLAGLLWAKRRIGR